MDIAQWRLTAKLLDKFVGHLITQALRLFEIQHALVLLTLVTLGSAEDGIGIRYGAVQYESLVR